MEQNKEILEQLEEIKKDLEDGYHGDVLRRLELVKYLTKELFEDWAKFRDFDVESINFK